MFNNNIIIMTDGVMEPRRYYHMVYTHANIVIVKSVYEITYDYYTHVYRS